MYKECYLKTAQKQLEFEVDIVGQDDLSVRHIGFMGKWQLYLGHQQPLMAHPSLSLETRVQLEASNIYPLRHSIVTALCACGIDSSSDSDDSYDEAARRGAGGRWLREILLDAVSEGDDVFETAVLDEGDISGEDYFKEFGIMPIAALEHNLKKVIDVVWGRGPKELKVPDMHHNRCGHSLVTTFDDHVMAMGGYGGDTVYHNSVERLDSEKGWELLGPMKFSRSGFAAGVGIGGRVLVAGGSKMVRFRWG